MIKPQHVVTKRVSAHNPISGCLEPTEVVIAAGSKEAMEAVRRLMQIPDGPNAPK